MSTIAVVLLLAGALAGAFVSGLAGLSDRTFRDIVLGLLFLSGVALVWSTVGMS